MLRKIITVLEMVKFQHSLFALPWACAGALYAAGGLPSGMQLVWILTAMVAARSAAMTFNRIADAKIDAENPRTRDRAIPRGLVSRGFAGVFAIVMIAVFVTSAALLNRLCLLLSPIALVVILGYSFTKRFTALCHFALGLSLALAPAGAWLAVRPEWHPLPFFFAGAVLFWIAGADILYACEDIDFDRAKGLHSIPAAIGIRGALRISILCHVATLGSLAAGGILGRLGIVYHAGIGAVALLLAYEHAIVRPDDLRRANRAFFHVNAVVSAAILAIAIGDLWQRRFF